MKNLTESCLFQEITQPEIDKMLACAKAKQKTYQAGELIFQQDEKPEKLFLLLEGTVYIVKDFPSGKRDMLYMVDSGNVFGEIFLFGNQNQYWYDAIAKTNCQILEIPWHFFYHFCENACHHHQMITKNMLEILSQKDFQMMKKLHIISTASLRERLAIWLIDSMDEHGFITLHLNREALADFLGVARPSLSRELMRMQNEHLIEVSKKSIQILDMESLELLYG